MPHPPGLLQGGNDVDTKAESVIFLKLPTQESCTKIVHFETQKEKILLPSLESGVMSTLKHIHILVQMDSIKQFTILFQLFILNPLILAPDRPNVCDCGWVT